MTFNLEVFVGISCDIATLGSTTAERMKSDPYRPRQRSNSQNVLFSIMFLVLICGRFLR